MTTAASADRKSTRAKKTGSYQRACIMSTLLLAIALVSPRVSKCPLHLSLKSLGIGLSMTRMLFSSLRRSSLLVRGSELRGDGTNQRASLFFYKAGKEESLVLSLGYSVVCQLVSGRKLSRRASLPAFRCTRPAQEGDNADLGLLSTQNCFRLP